MLQKPEKQILQKKHGSKKGSERREDSLSKALKKKNPDYFR